jgi:hypothetical protein
LSYYYEPEEPVTLADLAQPEDATKSAPRAHTVLFSLLGAAVVVAGLIVGGGWAVSAIAHTEAGFCGRGGAPCTTLPLERVEDFAVVDLPEGSTISDVYLQRALDGGAFRATVTLPAGFSDEVVAGVPSVESEVDGQRRVTFDYVWTQ